MAMIKYKFLLIKYAKLATLDRGSISVLTSGLFILTLSLAVTLSNVSSIAMAKRTLTQATESAAQRGVRNLDSSAYYKGKFNEISMVKNLLGHGQADPGIPIDCDQAHRDISGAIQDWSKGDIALTRFEITSVEIDEINCDGFQVSVSTHADIALPFVLPFINIRTARINSLASTENKRSEGFYLFGIRIA